MLSSDDLESVIALKKREILKEKALLGLAPLPNESTDFTHENKENETEPKTKTVIFQDAEKPIVLSENNAKSDEKTELYELEEHIPAGLERYIRRYMGMPMMLKAGEFSPNNPLVRGERVSGVCGDALLGLGEYERRRNTLRKIRQEQYREYLDRQAKKKQEAKDEAERQRREHEQKEKEREERERQILLERERYSPEIRRASISCVPVTYGTTTLHTKVDSAVQVDGMCRPLSVGVQTDEVEFYRLSPSPSKLTQAERELSPRTVSDVKWDKWENDRRRSYGDYDERTCSIQKSNRAKLHSDLRHSYMPSIFDADAIQLRNMQAEKEATERRQCYQQELKNQIMEQQRIREERKSREKLLEQAEMRRLEEQLRMLRVAQEREIDKHHDITAAMKINARDYETKRIELQRGIDQENQNLRASSHPTRNVPRRPPNSSKSDQKLPHYYRNEKTFQPIPKKPYSFNIPDNSLFSNNYDVDSYLRKNLNFRKHGVELSKRDDRDRDVEAIEREVRESDEIRDFENEERYTESYADIKGHESTKFVETALIHEPKLQKIEKPSTIFHAKDKEKTVLKPDTDLSVPVLRHSPARQAESDVNTSQLSEAMKKIDDKWKIPAVQKNILKSLPSGDGTSVSILTQLGSIRRQLQLEQLKLDKMLSPDDS